MTFKAQEKLVCLAGIKCLLLDVPAEASRSWSEWFAGDQKLKVLFSLLSTVTSALAGLWLFFVLPKRSDYKMRNRKLGDEMKVGRG